MDAYRDQYAQLFNNGKNVVLLAISVDAPEPLAAWAKEKGYQFGFLSDPGGTVGQLYGAFDTEYKLDSRTVFVVGPDGKIAYVAAPFRELDRTAYQQLGEAVSKVGGG